MEKKENEQKVTDLIVGILTIIVLGIIVYFLLIMLGTGFIKAIRGLIAEVSKLDAVVIVSLLTGGLSLLGVIISSIVSKILEFKRNKKEYLSQKREKPYGEFVDMVYKIQGNISTKDKSYTEQMMIEDISKFSRQLTLWGSRKVVKKWIKFRKNGNKPKAEVENIFVLEQIMNEMRNDLGLKRMKKGELLAFFVNDIDDVIK